MVGYYECLQLLAPKITNELVITSIAGVSREWHNLKHRDGNFYGVYMGGATAIALGIALALPHRRVISLDADGSMLMGLTVLPVIAQQNPSNLIIIVCDNECYESAGNLPTFTADVANLAGMAREAGIRNVTQVRELSEFQEAIDEAFQANGASFITAKVKQSYRPVPYPVLYKVENKFQFVRYIEATEKLQIVRPALWKVKSEEVRVKL